MRSLAQKMKKLCPVEFSQKSFKTRKSMKFIKEIFGGQVLKRPAFGLRCADFAQIFFKSHIITKYQKLRCFGVPFLFEKLSNRASKKVWVLRTPPGVDRVKNSADDVSDLLKRKPCCHDTTISFK